MGELIEGTWHTTPLIKKNADGRFVRAPSSWRGEVRADGEAGADGRRFPVAAGRYRLIVAWGCPWAHRALLARALMGLEEAIAVDVVEPLMGEDGWAFAPLGEAPTPGSTHERSHGSRFLRELYVRADPQFTGRVTVPVLWDTVADTIVSNESAEIMRMFAEQFTALATRAGPLGLPGRMDEVDALSAELQKSVNQAVYRCGFAQRQAAYDEAIGELFAALGALDARLAKRRFLLGDVPCEADWRLFTTLVRFDWVYVTHFKCNVARLRDFAHLFAYTCDLYQWPHVAGTVHEAQTKAHYYRSHGQLNPSGIVPRGFVVDFATPHGRARLMQA